LGSAVEAVAFEAGRVVAGEGDVRVAVATGVTGA